MANSLLKESGEKRKYNVNYIRHGFTLKLKNGRGLPQCVVSFKVISDQSMKPSLLKRHLSGCHTELVDKDAAFFKQMEIGVKRVRLDKSGQVNQINQASLLASYMVALRIAQEKAPHTIAEKLILPCCKDIVRCLIGDDEEKNISYVSLPNDTVQRQICDIAEDIKQQVVREIRGAPLNKFAIQLDESTDASASCFRKVHLDGDFKEDFLFCHCLEFTTGEGVLK